jgi:hypothetical protein
VKVTVAVSAPLNADAPFVLATVNDKARATAAPLVVVAIETVDPLDGIVVNGPAVDEPSPKVSNVLWVNPGVVTTTAAELNVVKPE